ETCWVLVIGTQRKTKDRERCRRAGGWKSGVSGGRSVPFLGHDVLAFAAPAGWRGTPGSGVMLSRGAAVAGGPLRGLFFRKIISARSDEAIQREIGTAMTVVATQRAAVP